MEKVERKINNREILRQPCGFAFRKEKGGK